jgi:hypothetical protein
MPGKNPEAPRVKTLASAGTEFRAEDATWHRQLGAPQGTNHSNASLHTHDWPSHRKTATSNSSCQWTQPWLGASSFYVRVPQLPSPHPGLAEQTRACAPSTGAAGGVSRTPCSPLNNWMSRPARPDPFLAHSSRLQRSLGSQPVGWVWPVSWPLPPHLETWLKWAHLDNLGLSHYFKVSWVKTLINPNATLIPLSM